MRLDSHANDRR